LGAYIIPNPKMRMDFSAFKEYLGQGGDEVFGFSSEFFSSYSSFNYFNLVYEFYQVLVRCSVCIWTGFPYLWKFRSIFTNYNNDNNSEKYWIVGCILIFTHVYS